MWLFADTTPLPPMPTSSDLTTVQAWGIGAFLTAIGTGLVALFRWIDGQFAKKDAALGKLIDTTNERLDIKDKLIREMASEFKIALGTAVDKLATQIRETNDRMFGAFESQNEVLGAIKGEMNASKEAHTAVMNEVKRSLDALAQRVDRMDRDPKKPN